MRHEQQGAEGLFMGCLFAAAAISIVLIVAAAIIGVGYLIGVLTG